MPCDRKESDRKYREAHKEQIALSKSVYNILNRERIKEYKKNYYLKKKENKE